MSKRMSKNRQVVVALFLIAALLAPTWHTGHAASGAAPAEPVSRQTPAPQAAAAPSDLPDVPGASADWWAAVQQQIEDDRFVLSQDDADSGAPSFAAHNPVHAFDLAFSGDGVRVAPAGKQAEPDAAEAWSWGLRLTGYGYDGRVRPFADPPGMKADGQELTYARAGLTEWYVNDERGLEQGFVLEAPPPGAGARRALVLHMALDTGLVPVLSDDAQSIDFLAGADGAAVLRYTDLAVVDADGNELSAHLSVSSQAITIWINDEGAAYPLLVDPVVITPEWTVEGDQADDQLGFSVATAGDVNGDGYDDVIVGVPGYGTDVGRAYVYYGSASGLSTSPAWSDEGTWENTRFGASVSTAGDVNADGYDDVIVGAPRDLDGYVYVYEGSEDGLSAWPNWQMGVAEPQYGSSVGTAGDLDNDGYADVFVVSPGGSGLVRIYLGGVYGVGDTAEWEVAGKAAAAVGHGLVIGQPDYTNGQTGEGQVLFYEAWSSSELNPTGWHYESDVVGAHLGQSVSTAGDVNGDGRDDLIVGAPGYTNGQQGEGRAIVFHGGQFSSVLAEVNWTAESDQVDAAFGASVATAGDLNGDGYNDVVVGAPGYDSGQTNEGRVFVYYGSATGLSFLPQFTAESNQEDAAFGQAVGPAGDVNGDGYADVIVGAPGFDAVAADEGRAYLFLGSAPVITAHQWSVDGEAANDELGRSVATAGDVNGDGYSDVVVGAPYNDEAAMDAGKVTVYYGSDSGLGMAPAWTALGQAEEDGFGTVVGTAGDLNGDGYHDLVVSAPGHGGGRVYVYYGSATGLSAAGWVASGQYAGDTFGGAAATAGDVNRDGYDDLVIGAPAYPDGNAYGKVYLYHGSAAGLGSTAAWTAAGKSAGDRLGAAVATAGDVNADGYADVMIGMPVRSQVLVYHGGPGGLAAGAATWTATGDAGSQFGYAVATAGDVNGDGYSDVVIGAPMLDPVERADAGGAYVYYGAVGGLSSTANWSAGGAAAGNRMGAAVGTAGDTDGDGYADVVIGAYGSDSLAGRIGLHHGGSGD